MKYIVVLSFHIEPPKVPSAYPFCEEGPCVRLGWSIDSTLPEGWMAHHGDDVCGIVALVVGSTSHIIPTVLLPEPF
jgi:hypothetical protein